jgi:hypothetical protein
MIVCLMAPGVVTGTANLLQIPTDALLVMILFAGAIAVAGQLGWKTIYKYDTPRLKALALLAAVASMLWMIAMLYAPRATVLALVGEKLEVSIVGHEIIRYEDDSELSFQHCYRVQRIDNLTVADGMCRDRGEYELRDRVTVLMDRNGNLAETPDAVSGAWPWQVTGLASLPAVVVLGWFTAGIPAPRRRYRPQHM